MDTAVSPRRKFIGGVALASLLASLPIGLRPAEAQAAGSEPKGVDVKSDLVLRTPEATKALLSLAELSADCAVIANRCVSHCEAQMAAGEGKSFASCMISSSQMAVVCEAMSKLASMNSVRVIDFIDGCTSACTACKDACDQHKAHWAMGMHLECKKCSEHCDKMVGELARVKATLLKVS